MNLAAIYAKFVTKPEKERDPERLFVSDVGKCPRMIGYRMMQTKTDPISEQQFINKLIMFENAEHMEHVLAMALDEAGMLREYQAEVPINDRENWGGRLDIIANYMGVRVIEVKSLHPNNFRHEIDRPAHHFQARVYDMYCKQKYELTAPPLLWYVDRGGVNTAVEMDVSAVEDVATVLMDELETVRSEVHDAGEEALPEQKRELRYRKDNTEAVWEPCRDCYYCDYKTLCLPNMGKSVWAIRDSADGPWRLKKAADLAKMEELLTNIEWKVDA